MKLDALMRDFASVPHAIIGSGPRNPINPKPEFEPELVAYFEKYPFLREIDEYRQFLEQYGGAGVFYPEFVRPAVILDMFGIGRFTEDNELLGPDGFFCFSTCMIDYDSRRSVNTEFLFNSRNTRLGEVYGRETDEIQPAGGQLRIVYPSFLEWLSAVIQSRGFMRMPEA